MSQVEDCENYHSGAALTESCPDMTAAAFQFVQFTSPCALCKCPAVQPEHCEQTGLNVCCAMVSMAVQLCGSQRWIVLPPAVLQLPLLSASLNKRGKWGHASVEPHTQAPDDEMNGRERENGWELQRRQQENGEETQF